jgi:hypothetical protein
VNRSEPPTSYLISRAGSRMGLGDAAEIAVDRDGTFSSYVRSYVRGGR